MNYLIPFLILITIVVFIHEYGHYYFAKKYGVGITDFSIGFGREIFGWNDKSGTRWKICWIPLGGYVKFFGDRNVFSQSEQQELIDQYNDEDKKKLFILKPLYQRAIIVAAGPLANFLLAILIFTMINLFIGKDMTPAIIDEVQKDSPAFVSGLKKNDKILFIDDRKVESILEVSTFINISTSEQIEFKILRNDQELSVLIKPNLVDATDSLGNPAKKRMIGIKLFVLEKQENRNMKVVIRMTVYSILIVFFATPILAAVSLNQTKTFLVPLPAKSVCGILILTEVCVGLAEPSDLTLDLFNVSCVLSNSLPALLMISSKTRCNCNC